MGKGGNGKTVAPQDVNKEVIEEKQFSRFTLACNGGYLRTLVWCS